MRGANAARRGLRSCSALPLVLANPTFVLAQTSNATVAREEIPQAIPPTPTGSKQAASPPAAEKPIIITGSRIPRFNLTAVSPVTVIKQDEIKLQGTVAV